MLINRIQETINKQGVLKKHIKEIHNEFGMSKGKFDKIYQAEDLSEVSAGDLAEIAYHLDVDIQDLYTEVVFAVGLDYEYIKDGDYEVRDETVDLFEFQTLERAKDKIREHFSIREYPQGKLEDFQKFYAVYSIYPCVINNGEMENYDDYFQNQPPLEIDSDNVTFDITEILKTDKKIDMLTDIEEFIKHNLTQKDKFNSFDEDDFEFIESEYQSMIEDIETNDEKLKQLELKSLKASEVIKELENVLKRIENEIKSEEERFEILNKGK